MRILGLNAHGHDAAAVLLVDGEIAFAASQARFDRIRHSAAFPAEAVEAALAHAGLRPGDLDAVAFPWTRDMGRLPKAWHVLRHLPRSRAYWRDPPDAHVPDRAGYLHAMRGLASSLRQRGLRAPLVRIPHHQAHAASARLVMPGEGLVLTADGMGEWTTAALWQTEGPRLRRLARAVYPHSPGKAYAAVTQWLGFRPESDEGKTMGLAAYGDPATPGGRFAQGLLRPASRHLLRVTTPAFGFPWGEQRLFGDAFVAQVGPPRAPGENLRPGDADVAAGIQAAIEGWAETTLRGALATHDAGCVGLAGGLFLNCAMNGRLGRALPVPVCPMPVAGDAGAALGAAAHVHHQRTGSPAAPLRTLRLGTGIPTANDEDLPALAHRAAEVIARGGVVAVARGRAEFGPRALGARSLLASSSSTSRRDDVNARKGREAWRPVAPIVRAEDGHWFELPGPSPWMITTGVATEHARREIPGVIHEDGTARVQTVAADGDPFLRALLDALESLDHPACVINTSLNVPGEPIVDTAEQAQVAATAIGVDALVLGSRWIEGS